jgi:hypothetical protein
VSKHAHTTGDQFMATRSNIIVERQDGTFAISYCHWDGDVEGVGKTLHEHYSSQERAEALSALGDLSSVVDKPILEAPGHTFDNPVEGVVIAYGRDRGDEGCAPSIFPSLREALTQADNEYVYVWTGGSETESSVWMVGKPAGPKTKLRLVSDVLNGVTRKPIVAPEPVNRYLDGAEF